VAARSQGQVDKVAALASGRGRRCLAVAPDVADPAGVTDAFRKIVNSLGLIDVLVNNAGIVAPLGPAARIDSEAWCATVAISKTVNEPFLTLSAHRLGGLLHLH